MKRILLLYLACAVSIICFAADDDELYYDLPGYSSPIYVYTKGGKAVLAQKIDDNIETSLNRESLTQMTLMLYPDANIIDEATITYNCHTYAWHLRDGGTTVCRTPPVKPFSHTQNLSKYWSNDWYRETQYPSRAEKIIYYIGLDTTNDENITHSAVPSSIPGYYESKWGDLAVVRHLPDSVPVTYGTTKRYFYHPTFTAGILNCSNGSGSISINVAASYFIYNEPTSNNSGIWHIETANGSDAVERGFATINSSTKSSANITFTHIGLYEIYLDCYDIDNAHIGNYWFEAVVE